MKELTSIAEHGFLAVGLDAIHHGERLHPDLDIWMKTSEGFEERFLGMVEGTAAEIPSILDDLMQQSLIEDVRIGIMGVSMGAYITYRTLLDEKRIVAAVPLLGNPEWGEHPSSPHLRHEDFYPAAILSQTAGLDSSVPPAPARRLHEKLKTLYTDMPERQRYIEYRYSGHFMREDDWNTAWKFSMEWMKRFI